MRTADRRPVVSGAIGRWRAGGIAVLAAVGLAATGCNSGLRLAGDGGDADGASVEGDAVADVPADRSWDVPADALPEIEAACGDGMVEPGEECDDGNLIAGDGCEPDCIYSCPPEPSVPRPLLPWNGALTGSLHAPDSMGVLRPDFRWRAAAGGACASPAYEIQLDDSCSTPGFAACTFPSPEVDADGIAELDWRPASDLAVDDGPPVGRRYYWRVRACCGVCCSDWSVPRYVDVGRVENDFNGDGWSDVVIGAPQESSESAQPGRAYMFLGGGTPDGEPDLRLTADREPTSGSGAR